MIYDIIYSLNSSSNDQLKNLIRFNKTINFLICINYNRDINIKNTNIIYLEGNHLNNYNYVNKKYKFKYFVILNNTFFLKKNVNLSKLNSENLIIKKYFFEKKDIKILKSKNIEIIKNNCQGIFYKSKYFKQVYDFIISNKIDNPSDIIIKSLYKYYSKENFVKLNKNFFYNKSFKKKRMAICFFGIHYLECLNHWTGDKKRIDFRLYVDNFKEKVLDYFSKYFEIDIFICTNRSEFVKELLDIYQPKRHIIVENQTNQIFSKNNKVIKVLNCCINYQKDNDINYDNILLSRFDIFFEKEFNNIDYRKLNIISILECDHFICDNFYLFPQKYLISFYEIFLNHKTSVGHAFKCLFEKKMDINYICNEKKEVNLLSFYTLHKF